MTDNTPDTTLIKSLPASDLYPLRQSVLRDNGPIETCEFDGDTDSDSLHLGLYYPNTETLSGIISLYPNRLPQKPNPIKTDLPQSTCWQLRGMAIAQEFQGQGLGSPIIQAAIEMIQTKNGQLIWCHAREKAVSFYQRHGFEIISEPFEIKGIGTHYLMCLRIPH